MSGCWRRLRQGSKRELPERAALFLRAAHRREELPRAARGGWQRLLALLRDKGGILFPKRIPPLKPPEKGEGSPPSTPALRDLGLKSCSACGIGCLPSVAARRFDFLLSSLLRSRWQLCCLTDAAHPLRVPLCLRFVRLQQSLSTLDFISLAGACQGAALLRSPRCLHYR